ncbi:hypothetical protein WA026_006120 [Henosepilachna vigintioctopunctata]|uniref:alpha-glucosidase n=1 Tax=Henosepilachna vigintioctopunctata TaxID=420089 RepID=A0AAW1THW4_9CUCU
MCVKTFYFVLSFLLFHRCTPNENWWKNGIIYQVYPRSFKDSNNDGNGDLAGVIDKLPYLKSTGVDCVWLSPIMKSPQVDAGYDISDYYAIDKMYGNMNDFKELIGKAHELGLKIMLDFVPNHTSDQHRWFKESEKGNAKFKDFYVWRNAKKKGSPPNNWLSVFGGSAWQWSKKRKQFYLHQFAKEQPDLNFRNPAVRDEMKKVLVYYLDLGVDAFRIDAVKFLFEDEQFRDEPRSSDPNATPASHAYLDHIYTNNLPETFALLSEWRQLVDEYSETQGGPSRILVSEVYDDLYNTLQYYGTPERIGVHFTFNFFFITNLKQDISRAHDIARIVYTWQNALPAGKVTNWVIGNHDNHRVPTRLGAKNIDGFNMLLLLLPGVAVTYNGEEFGQDDGDVPFEQGKDPAAKDRATFNLLSRDFERTPMQWDDSTNAGFNEGAKPWLPVG